MSCRYEILPCTLAHLRALARTMRAEDRAEIEALGLKPRHVLVHQWKLSAAPKTILVDGEVGACWGDASPLLDDDGCIWLFTAPPIERIRYTYFREAQRELRRLLETRTVLRAHVTHDYAKSLRFFRMLGVSFGDEFQMGSTLYREGRVERDVCR